MICKSCGASIEEDSSFCRKCGKSVGAEDDKASQSGNKNNKNKIIAFVAVAVTAIVVAVCIAIAISGSKKHVEAPESTSESIRTTEPATGESLNAADVSFVSDRKIKNEGDEVVHGEGFVSAKYNDPKVYDEASIIIDGVKITLPSTPTEIAQLTGYEIDEPNEKLETMKTTFAHAEKGDCEITLYLANNELSPALYSDCRVYMITVYSDDVGSAALPFGAAVGSRVNLAGIIENFGVPESYYCSSNADNENISVEYPIGEDMHSHFEIVADGGYISEISVEISRL